MYCSALIGGKYYFFRIFAILTHWNELEFSSRGFQTNLHKKPKIPARAFLKIFEIIDFLNFGVIQNKCSMRKMNFQVNWDKEFISVVKTDIGAFWSARY